MKMLNKTILAALLCSTSALSFANGYVGGSLGSTDYDDSEIDDGTSFSLYAGYEFNENFAVEAAYTDFGDGDIDDYDMEIEVDGFSAVGLAKAPLNDDFELYAKVGILFWDVSVDFDGYSVGDDGSDLIYGAGASYKFCKPCKVRFEYLMADIEDGDVSNLNLGLSYYF